MSEIEEIRKKWSGEISSFPYAKGAKADIQILLSEIVRLQTRIKELEEEKASSKPPYLAEWERSQERVKELEDSMAQHFQKEHLEGDGPEIDRWKRRVKELEEGIEKHKNV